MMLTTDDNMMDKVNEYLQQSYAKVLTQDEDGGYLAEILEFDGCFSYGETPEEALENLADVAESWLEATIEKGKKVPEPLSSYDMSGKFLLRMPKNLHKRAAVLAEQDGVSLNTFIVSAISERVGTHTFINEIFSRLNSIIKTQLPVRFIFSEKNLLATAETGVQNEIEITPVSENKELLLAKT